MLAGNEMNAKRRQADGTLPQTVDLPLTDEEFQRLTGLAAFHRCSLEQLLRDALPRVIEKYTVLQGLGRAGRPEGPFQRRGAIQREAS